MIDASVHPQRLRILTTALCLAAAVMTIVSSLLSPDETLVVVFPALAILFVVAAPIFVTDSLDAFSPWAYMLYWVFIDVFLRSYYIANDVPNASTIDAIFLLGKGKDFLLLPGIVMLVGCVFLVLGYLSRSRADDRIGEIDLTRDEWSPRRLKIAIVVLIGLSSVGLTAFVIVTLGDVTTLVLQSLSAYRGISNDLGEYRAHGWLRALASLSDLAFYLTLTAALTSRKSPVWVKVACVLSFLMSALFFSFTQSRAGVLLLIINAFVLRYYFADRRLPIKLLPIAIPLLLSIFFGLTAIRTGSGYSLESLNTMSPLQFIEPIVVNNGGIDISKTGHIIDYVGPQLRLGLGSSYLWLLVAWIPRQYWPEKPVNIDTQVGMNIYGAETFGTGAVPPGFFGELILNFWYLGIPVGCWVLGRFIRALNSYFIARDVGRNTVVLYVIFVMNIGIGILGSSAVGFTAGALVQLVPMLVILRFISMPPQPKTLTGRT